MIPLCILIFLFITLFLLLPFRSVRAPSQIGVWNIILFIHGMVSFLLPLEIPPVSHMFRATLLALALRFLTGVNMSKTRAPPSGANPSNLVEKKVETEDDVLHIQVCTANPVHITQHFLEIFQRHFHSSSSIY